VRTTQQEHRKKSPIIFC